MKTEERRFDVNISDIVLTPYSCASLVNEILMGLLYQKCQIPYPYKLMKFMVNKKRQKLENEQNKQLNLKAANHFVTVSNFFDKLENAMQGIKAEIKEHQNDIKQILIVIGTTPHIATDVISINISSLIETDHLERNHMTQLNKFQQKILRNLFLCQDWVDNISSTLPCTNTYLFIVKNRTDAVINSDFIPTEPVKFSAKAKYTKISFCSETLPDSQCCKNLLVPEESNNLNKQSTIFDNKTEEDLVWYKYKDLVKGFKDCTVNKMSVTELW